MKKLIIAIIIIITAILTYQEYFSFDLLKENQQIFAAYYKENPILVTTLYFLLYVLITCLVIPGGALTLSILAGFLFGNTVGIILVSFASSIGATLAFLLSRYLFSNYFRKKFSRIYTTINKGMQENGALYLLALRLSPIFPFWIINLVSGLTKLKNSTFYIISQIGMFPLTVIIVNAGTQLNTLESAQDVFSLNIILSLTLVGLFPIIAYWIFKKYQ